MIVADSSFLIHGLLRDAEILSSDSIVTVDLALHEVANSIWKHEYVIKDINDGINFITTMIDLIDSGAITVITPDRKLIRSACSLCAKYKASFYDCIFIALALETEFRLKTMDSKQEKIFNAEVS